ncbi:MAG TPA: MBL fold metallo-hydrolase [Candidatus Krumholzibacteriaceae bacterium]|nr:MBL fold metallo-hydrolase [Candidatus Krumholzibacteriaceae bacterium]
MSIQTITTRRLVFGVNSHVVDGTVLVDTGFNAASANKIISEMEKQGSDPSRLELCIITHRHSDHVGGLRAIKDRLG